MPFDKAFPERLVIIGNSGSGKTTLARRIASRTGQPNCELDAIHWQADGTPQDRQAAMGQVTAAAAKPRWIIEGVYGWLAEAALPRATALVWLDLPWPACRRALLERGPKPGMGEAAHAALLDWAASYPSRSTSTSAAGHEGLFETFEGVRLRLASRKAAAAWLADWPRA